MRHIRWENVVLLSLALVFCSSAAFAQPLTCTWNPQFDLPVNAAGTGIVTAVVKNIQLIVNNLSRTLYNTIISSMGFQIAIRASLTIYIIIYGILFTFGLVQITMMDFIVRMIKIAIVGFLLTANSWTFFYSIMGTFFNDGTDWLIARFADIALGTPLANSSSAPFAVIDNAVSIILSSKLAVTLIAVFFTGPYGLLFGMIILMGLGTFLGAVVQAMFIYLMSLVVKAFLFGTAPIFVATLPFQRTRHLFDGWINQILSASLQPIFLFAFFAFFCQLIKASLILLLQIPVCLTAPGEIWRGTPFDVTIWRFTVNGQLYNGPWSFTGSDFPGAPVFPISIMNVLIFLLLVQLMKNFNGIVVQVAKDIAGASFDLQIGSSIANLFNPGGALTGGAQGGLNKLMGDVAKEGGANKVVDQVKKNIALLPGQRKPPA